MATVFGDFDASRFWEDSQYAAENYVEVSPSDDAIAALEIQLGYKLPNSYIDLARVQNGGCPINTSCRTDTPTSWAEDHIAITGIYAIGKSAHYSLGGPMNTQFWVSEWGYPPIGVYFADCPSAGHDMIALDYRACGSDGEPTVVHVDQESGYKITKLANTFEEFIRKLEPDDNFSDDASDDSSGVVESDSWLDI